MVKKERYKGYTEYNREYKREYMKKYRARLKQAGIVRLWNGAHYVKELRLRALKKLNPNLVCRRCGCNRVETLEINHIDGGGNKLRKSTYDVKKLYRDIIKGKDTRVEILCRVCNAAHYVEELQGIKGYKIIWTPG